MAETQTQVELLGDLPFAEVLNAAGQMETLRLDVYQPAGSVTAELRPAILWFHGGGFRPGNDKRQIYIPRLANAFAARGYVGIAPDYRVRSDPTPDFSGTTADAVADGRQALAWARAHASELRIDLSRLVVAGGSAGGMLILNLVHLPDPNRGKLAAVIDLWGTPGQVRLFKQVDPDSPPTLIIHGTADQLVPYQLSVDFAAELQAAGVPNELLTLPDAPHTPLMHFDQIVATIANFLARSL